MLSTWVRASIAWSRWSGEVSSTRRAALACTTITVMAWATTSCSSRAMRVRSSVTARWASVARSCSARTARSWASAKVWRRWRTFSPKTHGTISTAPLTSAVRAVGESCDRVAATK